MSNVAKLKRKALELEQKKQFDKAIAVYVELLQSFDQHMDELDVALFNRVGDLLMRQGNVADAVDYYERAVDHYTDGGFFNNAIALCNKILRHSPGRTSVHYKLGRISAKKGFKNDAKQSFLEYADRMQKSGNMNEAFRALKEFADLCPDQDDIRLMLADQLSKQNRKAEAIEQLQLLHERYTAEGREAEAAATARRLKTIDPAVEPRAGAEMPQQSSGDLVFLDLDSPSPRSTPYASAPAAPPPPSARPGSAPPKKLTPLDSSLPFIDLDEEEPAAAPEPPPPVRDRGGNPGHHVPSAPGPAAVEGADEMLDFERVNAPEASQLDGVTRAGDLGASTHEVASHSLPGLEPTHFGSQESVPETSADETEPDAYAPPAESYVEPTSLDADRQAALDAFRNWSPDAAAQMETAASAEDAGVDFLVPDVAEEASSQEILAELDPPILREEPLPPLLDTGLEFSDYDRGTEPTSVLSDDDTALPLIDFDAAKAAGQSLQDDAFIPSLTLDDEFVDRVEESGRGADDTPPMATWGSSNGAAAVVEPESDGPQVPVAPRESTMMAAQSVEMLEAAVEAEPENWTLRRDLAEAMLESGDRAGGLRELELAMAGAERSGDLEFASALAEEIARIDPGAIRHHQKRVEYAFRTNDKPRLIEAYISLGEALMRTEQMTKAKAVFQRVLDLAPDDIRAQAALESFAAMESAAVTRRAEQRRQGVGQPTPSSSSADLGSDFVNLGELLRDDEAPKDTRMVVPEHEPTGDEEADFQDMLRRFKQGIAENVDEADHQSHYDLGIAFKEMGLLDEAIAEFQKALRSPVNRVPTYEALGQCFMEKGQLAMAHTVLSRALHEKGMSEDQLVGVLYLIGRAAEAMNRPDEALGYYQRVFVVDITFRDVADRIHEVERAVR